MRSGTTSSAWPRTTPWRSGSPKGWPGCLESEPAARSPRRAEAREVDPADVETNIVFFDVTSTLDAPTAVQCLLARGVRIGALGPRTIRGVTHLDVDAAGIDRALAAARELFR